MSLHVTVDSVALDDLLHRLHKATGDLTPIMSAIGMKMENRVRGRFETQSDPLGVSWEPWKPATVKTYPKGGRGSILDRFGDMLAGSSHESDSTSATIGFDRPYATYHEFGTENMVRRGLLFADPEAGTLAPDDERAVIDIIMHALNAAL